MTSYPTSEDYKTGQSQTYSTDPSLAVGTASALGQFGKTGAEPIRPYGEEATSTTMGTYGHNQNQATFGDKLSGTFDTALGKATHDPSRVEQGEMKKDSQTYAHGTHSDGAFSRPNELSGDRPDFESGVLTSGQTHSAAGTGFRNDHTDQHLFSNNNKPSIGDKVSGTYDTVAGKVTGDRSQVEQGEIKKNIGSDGYSTVAQHNDNSITTAPAHTSVIHSGSTNHAYRGPGQAHGHSDDPFNLDHVSAAEFANDHPSRTDHHSSNNNNKVPVGNKVSGTVDTVVGKVTGDQSKVAEGEIKKSTPSHTTTASHAQGHGTHTAAGAHDNSHPDHKASFTDKLTGTIETVIGRVTGDHEKVEKGEIKRTIGSEALNNNH